MPYTSLTTISDSTGVLKVANREHGQALKLYNKALASVRQLAERDQIDDSVAVLSYMLFASVEFQQRDFKTGTDLVKRCGTILTENLTSLHTRHKSIASHAVHQVVSPFVLRKAITVATLGNGALSPQRDINHDTSNLLKTVLSRSPTLNAARVQFLSLVYESYEVIRHAEFVPDLEDDDWRKMYFLLQRQSLLDQLVQWKTSFISTSNRTPDVETNWISSYFLMYWAVCYTSLAACVTLRQTIFDDYVDHFAEIVEHAKVCLRQSTQSTNVQLLSSLEPGVIPLLYFCGTKCRDPILRREALRLMGQAPQQENLWAFVAPDRVVAKVISVEEGESQFYSSKTSPDSQYSGPPPEERRFAYVSVVGRQTPSGQLRQALELSRFEFAADGSISLVNEYAWLEDGE